MDNFSSCGSNQCVSEFFQSLDIVITNWNSGQQLAECLRSIAQFGDEAIASVVVVDNASTDGSVDTLEVFSLPLHVIRNRENLGFAKACNQGAAACSAPYILFLNPDARLFEGSIQAPLAFLEAPESKNIGICGVQLLDEYNRVARTCARFPTLSRLSVQAFGLDKLPGWESSGINMKGWSHSMSQSVDHVMGAFFLVRRVVFEALQGLDDRFFVYFEDVDFSYRAKKNGWGAMYLSEAQAFHAGGGTSRQVKATRLFYSLRSRLLYGFKHFPLWQAWLLMGLTLFVEPLTRLVFCIGQRRWADVRDTLRGYRMLWGAAPQVMSASRCARDK
ncbi:MAG: glycosyltransferase family 2 protein [Nitrococcus mobilis]|nr:glycosyltransferase family 2 protein [Nitrococcus mobilis]